LEAAESLVAGFQRVLKWKGVHSLLGKVEAEVLVVAAQIEISISTLELDLLNFNTNIPVNEPWDCK